MSVQLKPSNDQIADHIHQLTQRWNELDRPACYEIRCLKEGFAPFYERFMAGDTKQAVDRARLMNEQEYNCYVTVNPLDPNRIEGGGAANDNAVFASLYAFADADDEVAAGNIKNFAGPKYSFAVITGHTPVVRPHVYWELEEPCYNMQAWTGLQKSIASSLATDPVVHNPSRIMRLAGTVNWPTKKKQGRGYAAELTSINTKYDDDRDPIPFERLIKVFPETSKIPLLDTFIDVGPQPLDRDKARSQALSGEHWNDHVLKLVASYVTKGLNDDEVQELVKDLTFQTPESRRQIQKMIDGARAKGFAPLKQEEVFQPVEVKVKADATNEWPTLFTQFDVDALPVRRWVYDRHYIRGFVSVLASAGGIGKTSLQIVEALAIATGRDLLGEEVKEQCNVWLINLEDPLDEMHRRVLAAMQQYNIKEEQLAGKLYLDAGRDFQIKFAAQTRDGLMVNEALVEHMAKKIKEHSIGVVMIDPFVSAHEVSENDNMAINLVVDAIRNIADDTQAAVGLVHHIRKQNGVDADIDSVRGAGSLIGAARAARVINKIQPEDAQKLGVSEIESLGIFRVDDGKSNLTPPASKAVYRRMVGEELTNGDYVGVATAFKMPDLFDGVSPKDAMEVQRLVGAAAERDEPFRQSPQAKHWAGNAVAVVLDLDVGVKNDKAKALAILKKWIETDVLRLEMMPDKRRGGEVPCVVVGEWISHQEIN